MSQWINVKDQLPAKDPGRIFSDGHVSVRVLATNGRCITIACCLFTTHSPLEWLIPGYTYHQEDDIFNNVTHWMPLPEFPIISERSEL